KAGTLRQAPRLFAVATIADPDDVPRCDALLHAAAGRRSALFWEVSTGNFADRIPLIGELASWYPNLLQIAALDFDCHQAAMLLSEHGTAACVNHPHQLMRLRRLVQGYFVPGSTLLGFARIWMSESTL
ncbi:MAG: hypothetical protein AAGA03_09050, partial [Planctomycetota bacterium]